MKRCFCILLVLILAFTFLHVVAYGADELSTVETTVLVPTTPVPTNRNIDDWLQIAVNDDVLKNALIDSAFNEQLKEALKNGDISAIDDLIFQLSEKTGIDVDILKAKLSENEIINVTANIFIPSTGEGIPVNGVRVNSAAVSVEVGILSQLTATVSPSNATNKDVDWSSSKKTVANVSSKGVVIAEAVGKTLITCTAKDGSGKKAICLLTVIPKSPSSPKAVSASYDSIKLSWSAVAGANGYVIYRYNASKKAYEKIKVTTALSFINTSLTTGKTYYYKIKAYKTVGLENIYSNSTAMLTSKPIPATPGSVKAVRTSNTSIKLSWGFINGATGYVVYRYNSATKKFDKIKVTSATSFTNTSLKTGLTYLYKVRAYRNMKGENIYGNSTAATLIKVY